MLAIAKLSALQFLSITLGGLWCRGITGASTLLIFGCLGIVQASIAPGSLGAWVLGCLGAWASGRRRLGVWIWVSGRLDVLAYEVAGTRITL